MLIKGQEIDLNAPAFGEGAQQLEEVSEETIQETESNEQEKETESTEAEVEVEEESKVPYSRFKKFHDEAKQREIEAAEARAEADRWRAIAESRTQESKTEELPDYWTRLYGDSDESKEAWKIQQQLNADMKREAIEAARESLRQEMQEEQIRTQENISTIDENFETLSAYIGRELTEKEQSALLDIVDEYTPKDNDGNYLGSLISFDKAWEIMELKNQASNAPRKQSRDAVAGLTSSRSQGDTQAGNEANKDFNPSWGAFSAAIKGKI